MDFSELNDHNFLDLSETSLKAKDFANVLLLALSQLKIVKIKASDWENGAAVRSAVYKQKSEVENFLFGKPGTIWVIHRAEHKFDPNEVYLQWIEEGKFPESLTIRSPNSILSEESLEKPEIISLHKGESNGN